MRKLRESSRLSDVTFVVNIDACNTELKSDERTEGINAVLSLLHRSNAVIHSLVREQYKLYDLSVIPLLLFSLSLSSFFLSVHFPFPRDITITRIDVSAAKEPNFRRILVRRTWTPR